MNDGYETKNGKRYVAVNEDGKSFSFSMHGGATDQDANTYAKVYAGMSGFGRVRRVWETWA